MSPLNLAFSPDLQKSDLAQFGTLPGQGHTARRARPTAPRGLFIAFVWFVYSKTNSGILA